MSGTKAFVAGVGLTPSKGNQTVSSLISAATKALLDAGIGYDDVSHSLTSSNAGGKAFKAFDEEGIDVKNVKAGSEMKSALDLVGREAARCVLVTAVEKSSSVSFVIISDKFLRTHPYLQDSSASIRSADESSNASLQDICKSVWALRGWNDSQSGQKKTLRVGSLELSRADGQAVPKWKDVEHRPDGKHRLGHNPAKDTKEISMEDFEAVRAEKGERNHSSERVPFKQKGGDRAMLARL